MSATSRRAPVVTADTAFFWDGARDGRLLFQRCAACGILRHPPRPMCPSCRSFEWNTQEASGRGAIYSFVVHHHPPLPGFAMPLTIVLVELVEGVRLISNLVGADPAAVEIGAEVEIAFSEIVDDVRFPEFRLVEAVLE
jgi:uncharacterized protein